MHKGHVKGVSNRENSPCINSPIFCRPLHCLQPTHVIHHGDINYVLGSSRTKTLMKGLSTQPPPLENSAVMEVGGWHCRAPHLDPILKRKAKTVHRVFSTCFVRMLAQCAPGNAHSNRHTWASGGWAPLLAKLSDLIHGHYHSRGQLFYFGNIFVTICELVIFFSTKRFHIFSWQGSCTNGC